MNTLPNPAGGSNEPAPFDTELMMRHWAARSLAYSCATSDFWGDGLALDEALIAVFMARGWTRGMVRRAYKDADLLGYGFVLLNAEGAPRLYCKPLAAQGGAA